MSTGRIRLFYGCSYMHHLSDIGTSQITPPKTSTSFFEGSSNPRRPYSTTPFLDASCTALFHRSPAAHPSASRLHDPSTSPPT